MDNPKEDQRQVRLKNRSQRTVKYFLNVLSHITEGFHDRLGVFEKDYQELKFGKTYFLEVEKRRMVRDLVYYRDWFWTHVLNCRAAAVDEESAVIKQALFMYVQLLDIETKSFVQIMRLADPSYGLKETKTEAAPAHRQEVV